MLAILFLLASLTLGVWVTYPAGANLRLEERLAMGAALGLAITTLAAFVAALGLGVTSWTIALVGTVTGAAGIIGLSSDRWRTALVADWTDFRKRAKRRPFWIGAVVVGLFAALLTFIFWHALFSYHGTIYAGFGNVWGDWNQHLSQTTSFAYGHNLPPTLTTMSGQKLTYPFMTNFLSALMLRGGLPLVPAMVLPAILLALAGLGMVMTFTRHLAGGLAALLAVPLFYLIGGLGFVNAFVDLSHSHQPLLHFLGHQPHNYTQTIGGVFPNINFINTIYAYLVPQRAFLFGLPIVLSVLTLLTLGIRGRSTRLLLAAGLAAATLPFIHTHGLVFLGFITPPLIWLTRRRWGGRRKRVRLRDLTPWLWFLVPIAVVALPQFLWLIAGVDGGRFFRPQFGWTKGKDPFLWFWLKNLGLFIPLLIGAFFLKARRMVRPDWHEFALAAGVVFVAANLFVFQPWDWDNTKLLIYWVVVSVPAVAAALVWLAGRGRVGIAATVAVLLSLTLAGSFDVAKTLAWKTAKQPVFDGLAQDIASGVRAGAAPRAVFLTAQEADNPISALAGRRIVLGYTGWLWSYGIPYKDREADVATMFDGTDRTASLLKRYHVDYVVIGPAERGDHGYTVNEGYFASQYAVWKRFGEITIYDVNAPVCHCDTGTR